MKFETPDQYHAQAIDILSQSDPLIKLLQEVKLGKMQPTDGGLRAITVSWLLTYRQVLEEGADVPLSTLYKLNPEPRLDVLIEHGILSPDQTEVLTLRETFQDLLKKSDSVSSSSSGPS